tara:strand:+ start:50386 stop:52557 length:2172 start_codon:yes stop_codon:yes gene_type:complete
MSDKSKVSSKDPFLQSILQDDNILGQEYISSVPLTSENQVQRFNRQLERYGMTENSIKVLASNNIQGHISWRILVAREAYIRALQKSLLPTQYWSGLEQKNLNAKHVLQQKINNQKAEELKRFNFNQAYYNQKKAFILDQMTLMGYLAFLKSIYLSAEILLENKKERAEFENLIQAVEQEQLNLVNEQAKNIEDIEEKIRDVDRAIQLCDEELRDIRLYQQALTQEITTQTAVVEDLQEQIQKCDAELKQVDSAIEAQIALQEDLIAQLEGHEQEQQEAIQQLDQLLEKKDAIQIRKDKLEAEVEANEEKHEAHEAECLRLKTLLQDATSAKDKEALSKAYHAEFTEMTIKEYVCMSANLAIEDCDEESEQYLIEETELKTDVEKIQSSILSLKEKLTDCNQELAALRQKKQTLTNTRASLSGRLIKEQEKLELLNQELEKANEQETLLVENIKTYKALKVALNEELQDSKEIAALNKETKEISETLDDNIAKLDKVNNNIERREENIEKLKNQLESKKEAMIKRTQETGLPASAKKTKQIEKLEAKIHDLEYKYLPIEKAKQQTLEQLVSHQKTRQKEIPTRVTELTENIVRNQHRAQQMQLQIDQSEPRRQALQRTTLDLKQLKKPPQISTQAVPRQQINPPSSLAYADLHPSAPVLNNDNNDAQTHNPYATLRLSEQPSAPPHPDRKRDPYASSADDKKPSAPKTTDDKTEKKEKKFTNR